MDRFPTKRDYWYCFFIFIIIDVFLLVHWTEHPSLLGAKLELASTLISITLSVIAIIYTLVDSSNNKVTSSKIIESANTIKDVTTEMETSTKTLGQLTKSLTNLNIDTKFDSFEEKLCGIIDSVTSMYLAVGVVDNNINDIKNSMGKYSPNTSLNSDLAIIRPIEDKLKETSIYLVKTMDEEYYHIKELIYFANKVKQMDKPLFPYVSQYISEHIEVPNAVNLGVCYGVLGVLNHLGCLNWDDEDDKVNFILDELLPIIESFEKSNTKKSKTIMNFILNINSSTEVK